MLRICLFLISAAFFNTASYCQQLTSLNGIVKDENGVPMPYVNVGIPACNGTVTNIDGEFKLDISSCNPTDTLRISMIGYRPQIKILKELLNESLVAVQLTKSDYELKEAKVKSARLRNKEKGNFTQSDNMIAGFKTNDLGSELVIRIPVKNDAWVKKFKFYIAQSNFDTLFFRLNIYKMEKGFPGESILHHPVYVTTTSKKGWNSVNLEQYNIMVDGDFAIGLEWIRDLSQGEVSKGLMFSVGFLNKSCFYRKASQQAWNKTGIIGIGFNVLVAE